MLLGNHLGREPPGGPLVGDDIVDQHVGFAEQRLQPIAAIPGAEVGDGPTLVRVAVGVCHRPRLGPRQLTLNPHDVGSEIGEDAGAERAPQIRQVDHPQPAQRRGSRPCRAVSGHTQPSQPLSKDLDLADFLPVPRRASYRRATAPHVVRVDTGLAAGGP